MAEWNDEVGQLSEDTHTLRNMAHDIKEGIKAAVNDIRHGHANSEEG